ncbi:hypothetical protein QTG54_005104 [Skeletonema marinoi]|uniref:Uncharacterized protein n=1 Tax=Skeletonema marinoi TaxID=267567 RepID=A0AAD8YG83_9STRA|nr:hypothetical protein QTG54_005104 [Skeletonema marinoi]
MNFSIASILLATAAAASATTTSSKAYRIFSVDPRPKAGKASNSVISVSEGSLVTAKSTKNLILSSSLPLSYNSKTGKQAKMVKSAKAKVAKCIDQSVSMSLSTPDVVRRVLHDANSSLSASFSMETKAAKSKMSKCLPMSVSMSIETTAMPTYYPSYTPTDEPTDVPSQAPTTRRPTQVMVCQSGDFVDALGRDCFWYEAPNIELGCESLSSSEGELTNKGKTPWDECCFCGGGKMVALNTTVPDPDRKLAVVDESKDVVEQKMGVDLEVVPADANSIVCISNSYFVDPLGRDCSFYVQENIQEGCESLHGHGDMANEFSWTNDDGKTPWSECCFCGGGTLGYESSA